MAHRAGVKSAAYNYLELRRCLDAGVSAVACGCVAGWFNQEYRAAQRRGLPYPILRIAEYFTMDGGGLRWGRFYLEAGYFTHVMLW